MRLGYQNDNMQQNIETLDGLFQEPIQKETFERITTDLQRKEFIPIFNPHDEIRPIKSIAIETLWYNGSIHEYMESVSKDTKNYYWLSNQQRLQTVPPLIYNPQHFDTDFGEMMEQPYKLNKLVHTPKMNVFIWIDIDAYTKYLETFG